MNYERKKSSNSRKKSSNSQKKSSNSRKKSTNSRKQNSIQSSINESISKLKKLTAISEVHGQSLKSSKKSKISRLISASRNNKSDAINLRSAQPL